MRISRVRRGPGALNSSSLVGMPTAIFVNSKPHAPSNSVLIYNATTKLTLDSLCNTALSSHEPIARFQTSLTACRWLAGPWSNDLAVDGFQQSFCTEVGFMDMHCFSLRLSMERARIRSPHNSWSLSFVPCSSCSLFSGYSCFSSCFSDIFLPSNIVAFVQNVCSLYFSAGSNFYIFKSLVSSVKPCCP